MESEDGVIGRGKTLAEAFEAAAKKAVERYSRVGATMEELEAAFDERPFNAAIQVIVQPHNQWAKAYRVILTG